MPAFKCDVCGGLWPIEVSDPLPIRHHCRARTVERNSFRSKTPRGLGDFVATILARLGIRKRAGCGCQARREWLNRVGDWIVRLGR
jgi:hypothetical protein